MKSVKRAIIYGIGIWLLLVGVSLALFSLESYDSALFESLKFLALVTIVVSFTVHYISKIKSSGWGEGLAVGFTWLAITILLDLVLAAMGFFNLSLFDYFKDVASSYLVMPIVTFLTMHSLRAKA